MIALDLHDATFASRNPQREIHFIWPNGERLTIRAVSAKKGKARLQFEGLPGEVKIHKGRLTSPNDSDTDLK